nr:lactadherin-like [Pocillopora verrucosa]
MSRDKSKRRGEKANSGNYWLDSIIEGKTVLVPCDMETADADECKASLPVCDTNAICQNTPDSYICACKPGVIADGRTCTAVLSCEALGVEDPNIIPDVQITASSNYLSYYPHKGRLNGDSGWCQQSSRITDDYIQVDIGAGRTVCGVATQGKANGSFIKSYRLSFSTDGTSWTAYKEQNVEKIFEANSDLNTIIKHTLNNPVQARYIRFYPVTFSQYPCMRIEVFVQ